MVESTNQADEARAKQPDRSREAAPPSVSSTITYKGIEAAQKALIQRPKFTIRIRILLGLIFILSLSIAACLAFLNSLSVIQNKLHFLETASSLTVEIQHARHYQKNFFIYGRGLEVALEHVNNAQILMLGNSERWKGVIGEQSVDKMTRHLWRYAELLQGLASKEGKIGQGRSRAVDIKVEKEISKLAKEMISLAEELVSRERKGIVSVLEWAKRHQIYFLIALFSLLIFISNYLTKQVLRPIRRFVDYTQRLSTGDFSPITPAKGYRDEFSDLAIAFNSMLVKLKQDQEHLLQSRKMAAIGNLTAGIAHELNNPLNNISITVESLLDELDELSREELRKRLDDIYTQAERATGTVRNLLDFTRVEQPSFIQLGIKEILDSTIRLTRNEIRLKKIQLDTRIDQDLPKIQGDFGQLQQVFLNLIMNSIQAMPHGGKLTISAHVEDEKALRIDVSDTGIGIPEASLPHIFDPFFTTKEIGKGTGLGLSICYNIVKKHGGKILVSSQVNQMAALKASYDQGGTTFSVILPLSES